MIVDDIVDADPSIVEYIKARIINMQRFATLDGHPMSQDELIDVVCTMYANQKFLLKEREKANVNTVS